MVLHERFTERGWLHPSVAPVLKNLAMSLTFLSLALWCPGHVSDQGRLHPALLGLFVGMALHQLAFTVHDSMHGGVFPAKSTAHKACAVLGDLGFGVVGDHWDFEHVAHHVMSNCIDHDLQQRNAPIITVDWKQLTVKMETVELNERVQTWLLRINHWFWLIAATWGGRFALQGVGVAWVTEKLNQRWWHLLGILGHYTWLVCLIRARSAPMEYGGYTLGPWLGGLVTLLVAGILHIQLLVNHASRPMHSEQDDLRQSKDWVAWQAHATADIACSPYVDWFHGGLQFQITHHLFPRLRSDRLRDATPEVYEMLRSHSLDVHIYQGLTGGVAAVSRQLVKACEVAGHTTWPPTPVQPGAVRVVLLQFPTTFWVCVHFVLLGLCPYLGFEDEVFWKWFFVAFGSFAVFLLAPLVTEFMMPRAQPSASQSKVCKDGKAD